MTLKELKSKQILIVGRGVEGKADYVISGDEDLLILKEYEGIKIVNPREFSVVQNSFLLDLTI